MAKPQQGVYNVSTVRTTTPNNLTLHKHEHNAGHASRSAQVHLAVPLVRKNTSITFASLCRRGSSGGCSSCRCRSPVPPSIRRSPLPLASPAFVARTAAVSPVVVGIFPLSSVRVYLSPLVGWSRRVSCRFVTKDWTKYFRLVCLFRHSIFRSDRFGAVIA